MHNYRCRPTTQLIRLRKTPLPPAPGTAVVPSQDRLTGQLGTSALLHREFGKTSSLSHESVHSQRP
jgi:hypothetical protein